MGVVRMAKIVNGRLKRVVVYESEDMDEFPSLEEVGKLLDLLEQEDEEGEKGKGGGLNDQ